MLYFQGGLPSPREACYYRLRSGGESCPVQAKILLSDCQSPFEGVPGAIEIYRTIKSLLKDSPASACCLMITVHSKIFQTVGIDCVHSTDLLTRFANFKAALIDRKAWEREKRNETILAEKK